jgi:hypothetical protein
MIERERFFSPELYDILHEKRIPRDEMLPKISACIHKISLQFNMSENDIEEVVFSSDTLKKYRDDLKYIPKQKVIYFTSSKQGVVYDRLISSLRKSIEPVKSEMLFPGEILPDNGILVGLVINTSAVDLIDEQETTKWMKTRRSVVLIAFSDSARGKTDDFLRSINFEGLPEQKPQLNAFYNGKRIILRGMLKLQMNFDEDRVELTWDKSNTLNQPNNIDTYNVLVDKIKELVNM